MRIFQRLTGDQINHCFFHFSKGAKDGDIFSDIYFHSALSFSSFQRSTLILLDEHKGRATRNVHLHKMLPITPWPIRRKELALLTHTIMSSKARLIRIQSNPVLPRRGDSNAVVGKRFCRVEVENEDRTGTIKDEDLITLMLERDEGLRGREPSDLGLGMVHGRIELVQELVP
jgi:hypothetical protein